MMIAKLIDIFSETKRDDRNTVSKSAINRFLEEERYISGKVESITSGTSITRYNVSVYPRSIPYVLKMGREFNAFFDTNDCRLSQNGKYVQIEVPNKYRGTYGFKDCLLKLQTIPHDSDKLLVAIGEGLDGKCIIYDLAEMPHLLVAGQTGGGKSVFLHSLILSLITQYSKEELNLVLIDPKKVEFGFYRNAPQVREVVTTPDRAARRLRDLCDEMDNRFEIFAETQVRDITSYNKKAKVKMPRLVVIIEELADLIMDSEDEILRNVTRLVLKARASGIHVIIATQRPDAAFIGGTLKNNFQCRVAFSMATATDSGIILGARGGAEKLKGKGDGIFRPNSGQKIRFQSALITENEIENAVKILSSEASDV